MRASNRLGMIRIPSHREPTHPGEMLVEEFLTPMGISRRAAASGLRVPYSRLRALAARRRGIDASMALRLARYLGTSHDFWINLQMRWDIYHASIAEEPQLNRIRRFRRANR